jgi:hypothetical protein
VLALTRIDGGHVRLAHRVRLVGRLTLVQWTIERHLRVDQSGMNTALPNEGNMRFLNIGSRRAWRLFRRHASTWRCRRCVLGAPGAGGRSCLKRLHRLSPVSVDNTVDFVSDGISTFCSNALFSYLPKFLFICQASDKNAKFVCHIIDAYENRCHNKATRITVDNITQSSFRSLWPLHSHRLLPTIAIPGSVL